MKELDSLREVMLTLTNLYGTANNNQKRNLWNAYEKLEKAIVVIHCCNELPSNSLADWANKNHWVYNESRKEALSIGNVSRSFPCKSLNDVRQNAAAILATITHPENMTTEEVKEIEEIALEILEYCRENCG